MGHEMAWPMKRETKATPEETHCMCCGGPLPEKVTKEIIRLKESSAHCFAQGTCDKCMVRLGRKELNSGQKRTRQKNRPDW